MRRFRRPPGPARPAYPGPSSPACSCRREGRCGGHRRARSPFGPRRLGLGEQQPLVRVAALAGPFPSGGVRAALSRPREREEAGGEGMWGRCAPCVTDEGQAGPGQLPWLAMDGVGE